MKAQAQIDKIVFDGLQQICGQFALHHGAQSLRDDDSPGMQHARRVFLNSAQTLLVVRDTYLYPIHGASHLPQIVECVSGIVGRYVETLTLDAPTSCCNMAGDTVPCGMVQDAQ